MSSRLPGTRFPGGGYAPSSIYNSRRPSTGLSISIGSGLSPGLRYGSLGRGYGFGYPSALGYSSLQGRYGSGFGYSPYYYSARPSIGVSVFAAPSIYNQRYPDRYPPTSSTYRYTQPSSAYTRSPYADPTLDAQVRTNAYLGQNPLPQGMAPEGGMTQPRSTGDPSDPSTQLRPGMILPDGSRVISVGALPQGRSTDKQPTQLDNPQMAAPQMSAPKPAPVSASGPSVLERTAPQPSGPQPSALQPPVAPAPTPAELNPAQSNQPASEEAFSEEIEFEELPLGNATPATDL